METGVQRVDNKSMYPLSQFLKPPDPPTAVWMQFVAVFLSAHCTVLAVDGFSSEDINVVFSVKRNLFQDNQLLVLVVYEFD